MYLKGRAQVPCTCVCVRLWHWVSVLQFNASSIQHTAAPTRAMHTGTLNFNHTFDDEKSRLAPQSTRTRTGFVHTSTTRQTGPHHKLQRLPTSREHWLVSIGLASRKYRKAVSSQYHFISPSGLHHFHQAIGWARCGSIALRSRTVYSVRSVRPSVMRGQWW